MHTSISEFERRKPTKTFAAFKKVLKKYQKLNEVHPDTVVADLEELFKIFQTGE